MPGPVVDIVTGLVTAIISGGTVWLWQRGSRTRRQRKKAVFFGVRSGQTGLVVMPRHWQSEHAVARLDVYALLDVGSLVDGLGGRVEVRSAEELREGIGDRTEFCIGGPDSNPRTAAHLASFVPGVVFRPFSDVGHAVEIVSGTDRFVRAPDEREFVIVAKFRPAGTTHPVFVVSGQTAITNRAAIHFLRQHYAELAKTFSVRGDFCLIIRVTSPNIYGHELASLEKDITATAFNTTNTAQLAPPSPSMEG
jgi:hypothetical protein